MNTPIFIDTLSQGTTLHGKSYSYCIEEVLGQGSFGITYLASVKMQGELGSIDAKVKVAVKEFFMKEINGREGTTVTSGRKGGLFEDYRKIFIREANKLSKLQHPNIIKVLECFKANNTVYYTMEYLDGGSLDELINKKQGLPEAEASKYIRQIAEALSYMHKHKVLHLDLKPGNIMLSNGNAVLIDFGLSKQYDESGNPESSTNVGAGTPGYAPIEQANYRDSKDFPVTMDIYALGGTMYKMLTGKRPPKASEVLNDGLPDKPSSVSSETWAAVKAAMEPVRKNRPQTIDAWMQLLASATSNVNDRDSENDEQTVVAEVTEVSVPQHKQTSGNHNGHAWVDLGLSVKWATCNIGADSPDDYGDYFAWGENRPKSRYDWYNCFDCIDGKWNGRWGIYNIGGKTSISPTSGHDTARENWGGSWRMPTDAEFEELCKKCEWTWTFQGGHEGYKVTGPNGNSIFLPAAGWRDGTGTGNGGEGGYYWSSTLSSSYFGNARTLYFNSSYHYTSYDGRRVGRSVRPVTD